jgi:hypothetical protein
VASQAQQSPAGELRVVTTAAHSSKKHSSQLGTRDHGERAHQLGDAAVAAAEPTIQGAGSGMYNKLVTI